MNRTKLLIFVAGALVGGLIGGVAGYVINDLTSRENPEVMAEIRATEQRQVDLDDFLQQLAGPPAASPDAAPTTQPSDPPSTDPPSTDAPHVEVPDAPDAPDAPPGL